MGEARRRDPSGARDGHIYFTERPDLREELRTLAIGAAETAFENPGAFSYFEDVTRDGRYVVFRFSQFTSPSAIWIQRVG